MGKYERMCKELDKIVSALKNLGYKVVEEDETSLTFEVPGGRLVIDYNYSDACFRVYILQEDKEDW